jgi:hypothetical protein
MRVVRSLPSSLLTLPLTSSSDMQSEHSLSLFDENNNHPISVITNVVNTNTLNSNSNETKIHRYHLKRSVTGKYVLFSVKRYQLISPTLSTGHCSKNRKSDGEATRKLKVKRDNRRRQLEKQIRKLELKQNYLISQVGHLYLYKQQLEGKYQQTNSNHKRMYE